MAGDGSGKRKPRRPREWANEAERIRGYRAKVAHERNVIGASGTYVEMAEQIKTLNRDQPARRSAPEPVRFDNPDDAAEAAFETANDTYRGAANYADCDTERSADSEQNLPRRSVTTQTLHS